MTGTAKLLKALQDARSETLSAVSSGDMVKATASSMPFKILSLEINPAISGDEDLLSTYVIDVVNKLIEKSMPSGRHVDCLPARLPMRVHLLTPEQANAIHPGMGDIIREMHERQPQKDQADHGQDTV